MKNRIIISELEIQYKVSKLAEQIAEDSKNQELVIVAVLKGAFMFAADLVRHLSKKGIKLELDFLTTSSYSNQTVSSNKLEILMDLNLDIEGKKVLLIDDIIDTGLTLKEVYDFLNNKNPAEIKTCVLLDKSERRSVEFKPDYSGFVIPDCFVVGYGLDYNHNFRGLPYIVQLSGDEV